METKLQNFVNIAHQSLRTGGEIGLDNAQQLQVKSGNIRGRLARWIRQRVFPKKTQMENMRVLSKLEETIHREFPETPKNKIRAAIKRTDGMPLARRILLTSRQVERASLYKPQDTLDGEINEAIRLGYAADVVRADSKADKPALSDQEFKYVVGQYNGTMSDLHTRFPKLRNVPPPILSQLKPTGGRSVNGCYDHAQQTLQFTNKSDKRWKRSIAASQASGHSTPKASGLPGTIAHEYGHHLSLSVVPERKWYPELCNRLAANGLIPNPAMPSGFVDNADFNKGIKDNLDKLGVGRYASTNSKEFVAEVLAWYMHPNYDKGTVPKMPAYLEQWIQSQFPFLRKS